MSTQESEREKDAAVAENVKEESRPIDDSEAARIVGGSGPAGADFDRWHNLPDGSGSGTGE